jgi:digeranylgeranylglycerophospholipid reductase
MKIDIIGAGPAGSYVGFLLASRGHKVTVYERDPEIGKPVQCTGILSDYFEKLMVPSKDFVLNVVEKTRIYAPNGRYIDARIRPNYVICRKKFDNHLADMARTKGVVFLLNHSFNSFISKGNKITSLLSNKGRKVRSNADVLIGADGPLSEVAKSAGLFKAIMFIIGSQVEIEYQNDNAVEFYPYLGCYAWIVPVNRGVARIGVSSYKNSQSLLKDLLHKKLGQKLAGLKSENQSGVIPLFDAGIQAQKGNVYLVGDAATFNKATSGGGINQALKAGNILADCIHNRKNYNHAWKKQMFLELYLHLRLHRMMQKFNEDDWNRLIDIFSAPKMRDILYSESRDRLIPMLIRIALAKPELALFARYI